MQNSANKNETRAVSGSVELLDDEFEIEPILLGHGMPEGGASGGPCGPGRCSVCSGRCSCCGSCSCNTVYGAEGW